MPLSQLIAEGQRFRRRLEALKQNAAIAWYPYPTLALMDVLPRVLTGSTAALFDELAGGRMLDLGCADGDLGFFLESQGFDVTAMDHPPTSHNHGAGFRHLHAQLASRVPLLPVDLDHPQLPARQTDLAILLGVLYHLRNPFTILEELALRSRYLLTSTRVMRRSPQGRDLADLPVAWFLDEHETNADATNYWILTPAAFEKMLRRAGWQPLAVHHHGDTQASNPADYQHDERMFCVARSRHFQLDACELTRGWFALEPGPFRWTEPEFAFRFHEPCAPGTLELDFYLPDALNAPVTLQGFAGARPLPPQTFTTGGEHVYRAAWPGGSEVDLTFRVTASWTDFPPHEPRGVVVPFRAAPLRVLYPEK